MINLTESTLTQSTNETLEDPESHAWDAKPGRGKLKYLPNAINKRLVIIAGMLQKLF